MPLRHVDPTRPRSAAVRALNRFSRSRVGQFIARHFASKTDPWLGRISNGRLSWGMFNVPSATLKTKGAKSGQVRKAQIAYFHDGRDVVVIASNYGGDKHPQWYHNLVAHPECELGDEAFRASRGHGFRRLRPSVRARRAVLRRFRRLSDQDRTARSNDSGVPAHSAVAFSRCLISRRPSRPGANSGMINAAAPTIAAITRYDELFASTKAVLLISANWSPRGPSRPATSRACASESEAGPRTGSGNAASP